MYASAVVMSNNNNSANSLSEEAVSTVSSVTRVHHQDFFNHPLMAISPHDPPPNPHQTIKKKRSLPGNPDPDAEVIALSPKTLMATNRFVCEICNKGFQRDQNMQLHRRGHNLPWKLKQRNSKDQMRKRAYVCPEPTCVHHHPSRALGDLTGIKKHFCRKHGEKKWKCEKCEKIYAVQSDWKAHSKTCGTREYRCDCGTLFSRKDSFITHRAFCNALAEESARLSAAAAAAASVTVASTTTNPTINSITTTPFNININNPQPPHLFHDFPTRHSWDPTTTPIIIIKPEIITTNPPPLASPFYDDATVIPAPQYVSTATSAHLSATALLQKATTVGSTQSTMLQGSEISPGDLAAWQKTNNLTRDFLGLNGDHHHQYRHHQYHHHDHHGGGGGAGGRNGNAGAVDADVSMNVRNLLTYTGGVELPTYDRDHSLMKPHGFGFSEPAEGHCYD